MIYRLVKLFKNKVVYLTMANKVFIGTWVSDETRRNLKAKCAERNLYQGDVIELLIKNWLNEDHIKVPSHWHRRL